MKRAIGLFLIAAVAMIAMTSSSSESKGIQFSKLTVDEAKAESENTGKLIFIDAYTNWCGPCKRMAATSFQDPEVGKVFNEKFINLKVEMEKDADGPELARMYRVKAYPTLLIIDGNGNLIKRVVGFQTKDHLLALANSLN